MNISDAARELLRYDHVIYVDREGVVQGQMQDCEDGEWVPYEDHTTATAALTLELATCKQSLQVAEQQLAEAREDSRRLDWLEDQKIVTLSKSALRDRWQVSTLQIDKFDDEQVYDGNLRACIDAANAALTQPNTNDTH